MSSQIATSRYPVVRLSRKVVRDYLLLNVLPQDGTSRKRRCDYYDDDDEEASDGNNSELTKSQTEPAQLSKRQSNQHAATTNAWNLARMKIVSDVDVQDSVTMQPIIILERITTETEVMRSNSEAKPSKVPPKSKTTGKKVPTKRPTPKKAVKTGRPAFVLPHTSTTRTRSAKF